MITDPRSSLTETAKSGRKESSFLAEMPPIKFIRAANLQSPVLVRKFQPECHRNTRLGCALTNAINICIRSYCLSSELHIATAIETQEQANKTAQNYLTHKFYPQWPVLHSSLAIFWSYVALCSLQRGLR